MIEMWKKAAAAARLAGLAGLAGLVAAIGAGGVLPGPAMARTANGAAAPPSVASTRGDDVADGGSDAAAALEKTYPALREQVLRAEAAGGNVFVCHAICKVSSKLWNSPMYHIVGGRGDTRQRAFADMQAACGHPELPPVDGVGEELLAAENKAWKLYSNPLTSCESLRD